MTEKTLLTRKEEELLANLLPDTTRHRTFADLVKRWQHIIEGVENGYRLTIYDYTNDLTIREILSRIADATNPKLKGKIVSLLEPLDMRFIEATFVSAKPPFPGAFARNPQAWWYARLPRKLVGELKADSEREGLVASETK